MLKLVLVAALTCQAGEQLVDLRGKLPKYQQYIDILVSVEPAYSRFYIYQLGFPDSFQQCCSGKPTAVLRVPVGEARFCIRQSQAQMKWTAKILLRPDLEL
jgi:hypothetical protein